MKKAVFVIAVSLIVVTLATSVLAVGPENAIDKNPNLRGPTPYGFDPILDNGVDHGYLLYVYPPCKT